MVSGFYAQLLIIFTLVVVVSVGLEKFKKIAIPIVVGDILLGMVFGKSGFHVLGESSEIAFVADIGFAVLMFLSGLEVDLSSLMPDKNADKFKKKAWTSKPIVLAWIIFVGSLLLAFLFSAIFSVCGIECNIVMLALLLSTTSLGVVVPVLKEKDMLKQTFGQVILMAALVADVATMLLITIYISWCGTGNILPCLLIGVLFLVFALVTFLGRKAMHVEIIHRIKDGTGQIMVKISFFILFVFICLAQSLGIEIILGAFIAGLIISIITEKGVFRIREKMDIIGYGFFIPIFFINIGATFDITDVIHNKQALVLIPILLVVFFLVKLIPIMILKKSYTWRHTISAGFLMSSRLSLIIAAGAIAMKMGLISDALYGSLLLTAILSCTMSPLIFNKIFGRHTDSEEELEKLSQTIHEAH